MATKLKKIVKYPAATKAELDQLAQLRQALIDGAKKNEFLVRRAEFLQQQGLLYLNQARELRHDLDVATGHLGANLSSGENLLKLIDDRIEKFETRQTLKKLAAITKKRVAANRRRKHR